MNDVTIEIYITSTCPDCKAVKEYLPQHNFHFTVHDIKT
ncbi:glutaredoxin family protein [Virgibacillus oceani]